MDLSTIIIGVILMGLFIMPFTLTGRSRKKREKLILQSLTNTANKNNCQISQHEICGDYGIGIDENKNVVVFFKQLKEKAIEEYIELNKIENCLVNKITKTVPTHEGNQTVIDKLELGFIPINKNHKAINLEFYNTAIYMQVYGELQSVEKWSKLISDRLKIKK
jgi:hypothetical protein